MSSKCAVQGLAALFLHGPRVAMLCTALRTHFFVPFGIRSSTTKKNDDFFFSALRERARRSTRAAAQASQTKNLFFSKQYSRDELYFFYCWENVLEKYFFLRENPKKAPYFSAGMNLVPILRTFNLTFKGHLQE